MQGRILIRSIKKDSVRNTGFRLNVEPTTINVIEYDLSLLTERRSKVHHANLKSLKFYISPCLPFKKKRTLWVKIVDETFIVCKSFSDFSPEFLGFPDSPRYALEAVIVHLYKESTPHYKVFIHRNSPSLLQLWFMNDQ